VSRNLESNLEGRGLIREAKARYRAVAPQKKKKKNLTTEANNYRVSTIKQM
jgi:hypothetical protein